MTVSWDVVREEFEINTRQDELESASFSESAFYKFFLKKIKKNLGMSMEWISI